MHRSLMQHGSQLQCTFRYLIGVVCWLHGRMEMEELDDTLDGVSAGCMLGGVWWVWACVGGLRAEAGCMAR